MECCFSDDCGAYAVTPVLMAPCYPTKCSEDPPMCYPYLPRCPKRQATYYDDKKTKTPPRILDQDYMESKCGKCSNRNQRISTSPYQHKHSPPPTCPSSKTNCSQPPQNCCPTCYQPCKPVKTKYVMPCYRYEDGRIEHYVPTRSGRLPMSAYRRNGMQDQIHGYKGAIRYLCAGESFHGNCVYTTVEPLRRIYPKVTQEITAVQKLPVTAFKRNGMQDQEHSKLLGTANFLFRCPRDVSIECDVCTKPIKVGDPAKVPTYTTKSELECCLMRKKPIEVSLEDILDN